MRVLSLSLLLSILLVPTALASPKDKAVEPTDWGKVIGQVYDARTGNPIANAAVSIQQDGEFAASGHGAGKTDAMGRYQCEAMLGRVSSNLDVGRLLNTGIFGLLGGGATKKTKRVDITRLNVRVERPGYRPFEGVVPCRSVDAVHFAVTLEPILLAEASSAECSTAAEGWGMVRVVGVSVEPASMRPGATATVSVRVQSPPVARPGDLKVVCTSPLWGAKPLELHARGDARGEPLIYSGKLTAPKARQTRVELVTAFVIASPYDIALPDSSPEAGGSDLLQQQALVQVIATESELRAADTRMEVFRLRQTGDNPEAAARLKTLCERPEATAWDLRQWAELSQVLHDSATAVAALKRLVEMTPAAERLPPMGAYATALLSHEEGAKVLRECAPSVTTIKEKEWPKKVPLPLMLAMGQAYLQAKQVDQAAKINEALLKWPVAKRHPGHEGLECPRCRTWLGPLGTQLERAQMPCPRCGAELGQPGACPGTTEFRGALRLAQAQARRQADPGSAQARAEYGRVLVDLGRWEEAVDELRAALNADPNLRAVQRDLTYALLHLKGGESAVAESLDQALAAAEQQVLVGDGKKSSKSRDFFAWHSLAILRYRRACQQRDATDPAAAATLARSEEAFREALKCGRTGADVQSGNYSPFFGYTSPRIVAISGFAYPEANSDFVILDSLKALEKHPDNYLSHFSLGVALIDLGQPELAVGPIQTALKLRPDFVEARYADGLLALQRGDREAALDRLLEVTKANPRHPHAHLKLARLYTEGGDPAAAAACLAAYARVYGTSR
jgi:tetratricopeptide (TPR) repeat protein